MHACININSCKNHKFSQENNNIDLVIIGEGEQKNFLYKLIKDKKIEDRVFLINSTDNVFYYMKKAEALLLSSLWEEVGFVIVEAAFSNLYVISSNCPNGPVEFLLNGKAGSIFNSNVPNELFLKIKEFVNENQNNLFIRKILAKKQSRLYTMFNHNNILNKII